MESGENDGGKKDQALVYIEEDVLYREKESKEAWASNQEEKELKKRDS